MSKHYLYLTNDKLVSLVIRSNVLVSRESFGVGDIQTPELEEQIAKYASSQTYLVTDLIEEDFRLDTIPHLRGSDQDAVLDRKLGQIYRGSPYRHAIVQGRETEGRRDDRVFLHAVTNPDLLKPLLALLNRKRVPLEGIYSSAVLSCRLLKALDSFFPHTMLVTIIPDFGLRQTYFKDEQIKFSRLTPIIYDESRSVGQLIAAETSRTWQYLDSLRYFEDADALEVCMLLHERDGAMMQEAIRSYPMLRYRILDINDVATKLKVSPAPTSSHAEEIFCHLYARSKLENHFAAPADSRFAAFRRGRIAIFSATAAILAATAAGAAFNLYYAAQITQEIDQRGRGEGALQSEYQSVVNSMRAQKSATDTVRDTSIFFNSQIRPAPAAPGRLFNEIAKVLEGYPLVRVNQILWATNNEPAFMPAAPQGFGAANAGLAGTSQVTSDNKAALAAAAALAASAAANAAPTPTSAENAANPPLPGNKYHVALLDAAIQPFDGNVRKALAEIDRLVEDLKKN
ncbi:MAG: hypothetical protein H7232_08625, partial [Aeromicrobium sp.]|nr:hypothetical protein [Burkholderiales bacterium]